MRDVNHLFAFSVPRPVMTPHVGASLVVHLAWATLGFEPRLRTSNDGSLGASLRATARELACHVVAVGHTADEVHVVVRHPPTVCVSELAHLLKAASSRASNRGAVEWQPGYVARTCDGDRLDAILDYVRGLSPNPPPLAAAAG